MKKYALLIATAALVFASCTKEMPGTDPTAPQDVIFTSPLTEGGLKGLKSGPPAVCSNPDADYALIIIEDRSVTPYVVSTYKPAVFTVNNVLYTQAIKLTPATYTVTTFALMSNSGTPADESDDVIVRATPNGDSDFAQFVTSPLDMTFSVFAFEKVEIEIEVLCFEEANYQSFGFAWFKPIESTVREMVFFGDFCTKFYLDYAGSAYAGQENGLKVDMPAIFKIEVWENGVLKGTYDNTPWLGEGQPLVVKYSDKSATVENFEFKLFILVKVGETFEYKYMNSWLFKDNEQLVTNIGTGPGADGVYDFVLGNCNAVLADFAFAPYMNLPGTANMVVNLNNDPIRLSYFKMTLTGIGSGFDIHNSTLDAFCNDRNVFITMGQNYPVDIYSSLLPATALPANIQNKEWDRVNWLANHLDQFAGYTWYEFQQVLWKLDDPTWNGAANGGVDAVDFSDANSRASKMYAAASAYGDGYVPLPGGWAAVVCVAGSNVQTIFTIVDP
ncbi:MAG: hypothetical protein A2X22_08170 [Bacteroidetes bacterium GWF2_49_14]|nr:MAG: hypothetical protein A2X22_08170 [Bacteroidetes bacterium GWF2_49_14]HBB91787.1 hypothetical protein [Bacteroidales bacterium]